MPLSRSVMLTKKSVDCMVSAIEIYNKPNFRYREELFSILAINSWELILKAKILADSNNDVRTIYSREYPTNNNGQKSKRWVYKENRSGNKLTLDIFGALKRLESNGLIDNVCHENIDLLIEIRDNAIHFYNTDQLLALKIQEVGMANLKSYLAYVQTWFSINLDKYNFYLMPMSFFHSVNPSLVTIGSHDAAVTGLLKLIAEKEISHPFNEDSPHNISIAIEARIVKSSDIDAQKLKISNDPNAPGVRIKIEDIQKTHPLDYKELTDKLSKRYSNFKINQKYHYIRKQLTSDQRYFLAYPQNPMNPQGASKPFYSVEVFDEFDKHYSRKTQ